MHTDSLCFEPGYEANARHTVSSIAGWTWNMYYKCKLLIIVLQKMVFQLIMNEQAQKLLCYVLITVKSN